MKIAILGYSGSGKSTLARKLGKRYGCDVLHFDQVHFLPGWKIRSAEDKLHITETFLNEHDAWIIDGNYTKLCFAWRMEEADQIVMLLFGRFNCLWRVTRRYLTYRGRSREDMTEGCNEKLDWEFVKWVLWKGRGKTARQRCAQVRQQYPGKTVIIRNQRELDAFAAQHGL